MRIHLHLPDYSPVYDRSINVPSTWAVDFRGWTDLLEDQVVGLKYAVSKAIQMPVVKLKPAYFQMDPGLMVLQFASLDGTLDTTKFIAMRRRRNADRDQPWMLQVFRGNPHPLLNDLLRFTIDTDVHVDCGQNLHVRERRATPANLQR